MLAHFPSSATPQTGARYESILAQDWDEFGNQAVALQAVPPAQQVGSQAREGAGLHGSGCALGLG